MTEKVVVVHKSIIDMWATSDDPPLPYDTIIKVLERIDNKIKETDPKNVVIVEESVNTGFTSLPQRVGIENTAILYGARARWCLFEARVVLEKCGIPVTLDVEGCLP